MYRKLPTYAELETALTWISKHLSDECPYARKTCQWYDKATQECREHCPNCWRSFISDCAEANVDPFFNS